MKNYDIGKMISVEHPDKHDKKCSPSFVTIEIEQLPTQNVIHFDGIILQ